jgi:hypothetical protein
MKNLSRMMLLLALSGCTWISPFDKFSEDKDACEQASRSYSPYTNNTGGAANDQWTACMKDHDWQNVVSK